ncbi:hypothetical protein ACNA6I_23155 (plasmid) [Rossellomorea sp. FS2]|uniref:hypothetical protein n=1 Tax=Rossellomorea sp. FS2 TaxID=3391447 RepID=UPI003A4E4799
MDYFLVLIKNRIRINTNKFLYLHKEAKTDKKELIFLSAVAIFLSLIVGVLSLGASSIAIFLLTGNVGEVIADYGSINWYTLILLISMLLLSTDNLINQYHKFSTTSEYKLMLTSPVDTKQFLLVKLIEPYITKSVIALFVIIPIILNLHFKLSLSVLNTAFLVAMLICLFLCSVLIRFIFIIFIIKQKASRKSLAPFSLFNILMYYLIISLILIALKPLIEYFPSYITDLIEKITIVFPLFYIEGLEISNIFLPIAWLTSQLSTLLSNEITVMTIIGILVLIFSTVLVFFWFKNLSNSLSKTGALETFFEMSHSTGSISKETLKNSKSFLDFTDFKNIIFLKDFRLLIRENKVYWFASIFTIMVGYSTLVVGYYFASKNLGFSGYDEYVGILLALFGNSIIANSMLDKYGFDAEGNNFNLLKLAPIKSSDLVLSKFYSLLAISVPFWILFVFVTNLLFQVNVIFVLLLLVSSTVAYGMTCLFSSIVYPDFYAEDITQLPTLKSKMLSTGVSTFYLSLIASVFYLGSSLNVSVFLISGASVLFGLLMFYLTVYKVEEYSAS